MLFRDLKSGYPIFVLNKTDVAVSQAKVVNVSPPHIDKFFNPVEMVVDLTIDQDGQNKTYTFKEGTEVGYVNDLVISTSRDGVLREVEVLKNQSEQALAQVDTYKNTLEKCSTILSEFNPALKEKKETEERFCKLEGSMAELKSIMMGLVKELKG